MHALTDSDIVGVWERGTANQPVYRALILLAFACSEMPHETLAKLSIGRRDSLLLKLRELTFGSRLRTIAHCPGCKERLEMAFDAGEIRAVSWQDPSQALSLQACGFEVIFRLPNSLDLVAIGKCKDVPDARSLLLDRCVLSIKQEGKEATGKLPSDVEDLVVKKMEAVDPQADIQLSLSCPFCSQKWNQTFDIVSFFWSEIDFWARRILEEVHALATTYGWSESEILALSPQRRGLYLEMVNR